MSAIVKTKLKAARDALAKKDFEKAKSAASDVLDYEPDNYNACVYPVHGSMLWYAERVLRTVFLACDGARRCRVAYAHAHAFA